MGFVIVHSSQICWTYYLEGITGIPAHIQNQHFVMFVGTCCLVLRQKVYLVKVSILKFVYKEPLIDYKIGDLFWIWS